MRVIKANDPSKWRQERTCSQCHSELEVEFADLTKHIQRGDRPFEGDVTLFQFSCPVCHRINTLLTKDLPEEFHYAVKTPPSCGWADR